MGGSRRFGVIFVFGSVATIARADDGSAPEEEPVTREAVIEDTSVGEAITETAAPG